MARRGKAARPEAPASGAPERESGRESGREPGREPGRDDADLCLDCGLCCDGTLFGAIVVHIPEREFVVSLGLQVGEDPAGGWVAPQPCSAFRGGDGCALYSVGRPMTCGSYRCAVVTEYTAGGVSHEDSLAVIAGMRSLAGALEAEMGLDAGGYSMGALAGFLAEHRPWVAPEQYETFLTTFHRFATLAQRHFGYSPRPDEEQALAAGARVASRPGRAQAGVDSPRATDAAQR